MTPLFSQPMPSQVCMTSFLHLNTIRVLSNSVLALPSFVIPLNWGQGFEASISVYKTTKFIKQQDCVAIFYYVCSKKLYILSLYLVETVLKWSDEVILVTRGVVPILPQREQCGSEISGCLVPPSSYSNFLLHIQTLTAVTMRQNVCLQQIIVLYCWRWKNYFKMMSFLPKSSQVWHIEPYLDCKCFAVKYSYVDTITHISVLRH